MFLVECYPEGFYSEPITIHYPNASKIKLTRGDIAQGINVINTFVFEMNMNNPAYTKINSFKTLIKVTNTKTMNVEFDGYVLRQSVTMDDNGKYSKEITCVEGKNYLNETKSRYGEYHNMTPKNFLIDVINFHNTQVPKEKQFTVRNVDVTNSTDNVYRYTDQESTTYDTIMEKLVNRLGGELRAVNENGKWYIDWLKSFGEHKDTSIRVGKNMKSAEQTENTDDVYSRWMIYGAEIEKKDNTNTNENDTYAAKERVGIASVNNGKPYIDDPVAIAQFGVRVGHKTFEDVSNKDILLQKGLNFVRTNKLISISNTVDAFDLSLIGKDIHEFSVYNWYPLNNPALSAKEEVRIIEKRINIITPHLTTLTFDDTQLTASKYQARLKKNQQSYNRLKSNMDNLIKSNVALSNSLTEAKTELTNIQNKLLNVDLDNLPHELQTILDGLYDVQKRIDALVIPEYGLATGTERGLMSSADKQKLDLILTTKIIDLDNLLERVEKLENMPEEPPEKDGI